MSREEEHEPCHSALTHLASVCVLLVVLVKAETLLLHTVALLFTP